MFQPTGPLLPTLALLLTLAALSIAAGWAVVAGRIKDTDPRAKRTVNYVTFGQWPSFFARFGLVQVGVCLAAMLLAGGALALRPSRDVKTTVRELDTLPLDKPAEIDVTESGPVTIHAKVIAPANSAATLLIADATNDSAPVRRLRVSSGNWAVWQGDAETNKLALTAAKPSDAAVDAATAVRVLVTTRTQH